MLLTLAIETADAKYAQIAPLLFYGFAALTVLSAWSIVLSGNIVRMSIYLLFTLAGAAGLYFMLSAEFLAAVQLIVYAGGTLILIIFGVMLTSKNPFMQLETSRFEKVLGVLVALLTAGGMLVAIFATEGLGSGKDLSEGYEQVQLIGEALLTKYLVPFEVSAVLLLVVMIGAAYMARRRKSKQVD